MSSTASVTAVTRLPRAIPLGIACATFSATIALVYAVIRVVQFFFYPEPDPALVVWSPHVAMFWRFWIGVYIGGPLGLGAFVFATSAPERAARWLVRFVTASAVAISLQGLLVP